MTEKELQALEKDQKEIINDKINFITDNDLDNQTDQQIDIQSKEEYHNLCDQIVNNQSWMYGIVFYLTYFILFNFSFLFLVLILIL
jgi:hypothetical protein